MPSDQRTLNLAVTLRDSGITRAADHAERETSGWRDLAGVLLREFAMRNRTFTAEQASAYGYSHGLPFPPDGRAYGSVVRAANRDGFIEHDGYETGTNPRHHGDVARRWKSRIYRRQQ